MTGVGSVTISNDLNLNSMLLVPNLDCNLLSIRTLTQEKNCVTKFLKNHCDFQYLVRGRQMCSGLYLLKVNVFPNGQPQKAMFGINSLSVVSSNNDSVVMLCHYRLRHSNFMYLEKLFPSLFKSKSSKFF